MTLSPNEAADALRDIATVETHSRRAFGYRQASPHLILWGVLWVFGYGVTATRHALGGSIWAAVWVIGLAGDVAISRRSGRRVSSTAAMQSPVYWQFPAITLLVYAFVVATCAVMAPVSGRQIGAFVPLVIAAGYVVLGLWLGLRFIAVGAALAVLTLGGFFLLPVYFGWWMAVVGGGALVLGGWWLRRV